MVKNDNRANLLVIGGVDPTTHAGILQDIKVANFFATECTAVITANTVQSDCHFKSLNTVADHVFCEQFDSVVRSHKPQVIKSGVLTSIAQIEILSKYLQAHPEIKYICDPVIGTSSGGKLMGVRLLLH